MHIYIHIHIHIYTYTYINALMQALLDSSHDAKLRYVCYTYTHGYSKNRILICCAFLKVILHTCMINT